jgi:Flp pilus assembly protein CpaB
MDASVQKLLPPLSLRGLSLLFALVIGIAGFFYLQHNEMDTVKQQVKIWVPKANLPAYTRVTSNELIEQSFIARNLPIETIKDRGQIEGHYTLALLAEGKPISRNLLSEKPIPTQISLQNDYVVFGINATSNMTLGGNLQRGEFVNIQFFDDSKATKSVVNSIIFNNVFVLDVKPKAVGIAKDIPIWVFVIAIPANRREEFSRGLLNDKVTIWRKF